MQVFELSGRHGSLEIGSKPCLKLTCVDPISRDQGPPVFSQVLGDVFVRHPTIAGVAPRRAPRIAHEESPAIRADHEVVVVTGGDYGVATAIVAVRPRIRDETTGKRIVKLTVNWKPKHAWEAASEVIFDIG